MSDTPRTTALAGTFYMADAEKCPDCGRQHEKVKMVTLEDAQRIEQELIDEKERSGRWHDEAQAEKMANMALEQKLEAANEKLRLIGIERGTHDCGCEACSTISLVCPASASSYAMAIVELREQLAKEKQSSADSSQIGTVGQAAWMELKQENKALHAELKKRNTHAMTGGVPG